jgi:hypothetical protein
MFTFSIRTEDEIRALSAAEVRDTIKAHLEDVLPDSFFEAHYDMKVVPIHEVEVLLQKERKLRGGSANNADPLCHFGLSHRLMCCPKKCECVYLILPRRLYVECFSLSLSHTHTMPHNHTHTHAQANDVAAKVARIVLGDETRAAHRVRHSQPYSFTRMPRHRPRASITSPLA